MWDLPRSGLEPVSPILAGGFLTTAPPGKSLASPSSFWSQGKQVPASHCGRSLQGACPTHWISSRTMLHQFPFPLLYFHLFSLTGSLSSAHKHDQASSSLKKKKKEQKPEPYTLSTLSCLSVLQLIPSLSFLPFPVKLHRRHMMFLNSPLFTLQLTVIWLLPPTFH